MKMIKVIGLVVGLVSMLGVAASAQTVGTGFYQLSWNNVVLAGTASSGYSNVLDIADGYYNFAITGGATLSPSDKTVTLSGLNNGRIWTYEVFSNGGWQELGKLVDPFSASNYQSVTKSSDAYVNNVYAEKMRIFYAIDMPTAGTMATVGGSAMMTATAVPEPGTILAALSILAPAGLAFRRKRA